MSEVNVPVIDTPIVIDKIVPKSTRIVGNSLVGISAVTGMIVTICEYDQPAPVVAAPQQQNAPAKRGRKPGQRGPGRPATKNVQVSPPPPAPVQQQPTIQ